MRQLRKVTALIVFTVLYCATPARADVVIDWNLITSQTIPTGPRGPAAILDYAMVHLAMHDAIQAFEGRFESYGLPLSGATGSPVAAAATAAHDVLVARFPAATATLDTLLTNYLSSLGLLGDPGIVIGQQAAGQIIAMRSGDGSWPANPEVFVGGTDPGEWRPTLPAFASMTTPWLGSVTPFALKDSAQLRASPPPPHLTSGEYVRDYDEVKAFGRAGASARSQAQTDLALFYSGNFLLLWQGTLRGIGDTVDSLGDNGRLFALANMAAADAVINAWDNKLYWNFWRPITAIQEGDKDGNPRTEGDASWLPFLPTPPYPEYTSGANNLTGAMTRTLAHLFGDKTTFSVFSAVAMVTKTYHRFSEMADDVVDARVYQGIHFRFGDVVGRRQGVRSSDWAVSHFLRPLE